MAQLVRLFAPAMTQAEHDHHVVRVKALADRLEQAAVDVRAAGGPDSTMAADCLDSDTHSLRWLIRRVTGVQGGE